MPITLVTGLPGNAKTLYTIKTVRDQALAQNRPVFYAGINELNLDWELIEPKEWMKCPPRSIVVIDEAQKIFRNRTVGTVPGAHVTDLETHRHLGIDLVFITQHPSLIDPSVRRLADRHLHMVRIMGMEASTVHEWSSVKDNCEKPRERVDSQKTRWKFDKSIYTLYKSAEEHTVQRRIPMRLKLLLLVPVALGCAAYAVYRLTVGKHPAPRVADPAMLAAQAAAAAAVSAPRPGAAVPFDPIADAKEYAAKNTPRVAGLQHTAPKYDELTKPTAVPVPAMCIQHGAQGEKCECKSQQATPLDVPFNMCIEFARNGYFREFDPEADRQRQLRGAESARILAAREEEGGAASSRVVAFSVPPAEQARRPLSGPLAGL